LNKILEVNKQAFRNELGVASVPVYSSLKKFIPRFSKDTGSAIFPLDSTWAEHGAWDDNNYAFRGMTMLFGLYMASHQALKTMQKKRSLLMQIVTAQCLRQQTTGCGQSPVV